MAKTTRPSKQLELPIMVDLMLQVERQTAKSTAPGQNREVGHGHTLSRKQVSEATQGDLSVYDAISANYARGAK